MAKTITIDFSDWKVSEDELKKLVYDNLVWRQMDDDISQSVKTSDHSDWRISYRAAGVRHRDEGAA